MDNTICCIIALSGFLLSNVQSEFRASNPPTFDFISLSDNLQASFIGGFFLPAKITAIVTDKSSLFFALLSVDVNENS